ncbi:DUF479 domain-containing protein [Aestuariicella hydrocarbonica]|uniref:DUF479 domain-containing protein n=1 Tax=Pseudomaricurvus hydrocarbonicus TaxID=1470433 RepID=A0A9E5MMH2_9GAMM|nr:acyl carrier protein phosphodiesterase [Aestuariicella hydrocarbonica]NHO66605.1 DUF479 domain-containing protein [Aestuariicella hydrocarbonica]
MNYLAHILLSGPDPDWQLGGFLGDFIKGPLPLTPLVPEAASRSSSPDQRAQPELLDRQGDPWALGVLEGVRLHRRLDAHVDRREDYGQCLALLGSDYRRVGGIALDVLFDHLLVRHWARFSDEPLQAFSQRFYRLCEQRSQRLPPSAARFMARASQHDLFQGYGDRDLFLPVLQRIDERIRFETNLVAAGDAALQHYAALEHHFLQLMPHLLDTSEQLRAQAGHRDS